MARARWKGGVSRQAGYASLAARTAVSTSSAPQSGTWASTSPVAGFKTSCDVVARGATHAPPI